MGQGRHLVTERGVVTEREEDSGTDTKGPSRKRLTEVRTENSL